LVTPEIAERVKAYENGKRPTRITETTRAFFDERTGNPVAWYFKSSNGDIEIFDLMGFHPDSGVELLPVTRDIVTNWKSQIARRAPRLIDDPEKFGFFDPITGNARVWYMREANGSYDFYDNLGFDPHSGNELTAINKDAIGEWRKLKVSSKQSLPRAPSRVQINADTKFFNPVDGSPFLWFWKRDVADYDFFDAPGYDPQNGEALKPFTKDEAKALEREIRQATPGSPAEPPISNAESRKVPDSTGRSAAGHRCDDLATNPNDQRRVGDGVAYDLLKSRAKEAIGSCQVAVKENPAELRFKYQLARAIELTPDRPKAFKLLQELADKGYPSAFDNLGWFYFYDRHDPAKAASLFRQGVQAGDPDAMLSLAEMIERNVTTPINGSETKLELYRRAAQLGDSHAAIAYQDEVGKQEQASQEQLRQIAQQKLMMQFIGAALSRIH
jgi:hypothetical protein